MAYEAQPPDYETTSLAIIFIHGTGGDREDWRHQLDGLAKAATCVALELPGHGASEPPGENSVSSFARWVVDFVEALGLHKVMLVGCSLGSAIVQWIALERPAWLKAIGLVGAGARLRVLPLFLEGLKNDADLALRTLGQYCLSPGAPESLLMTMGEKYLKTSAELIYNDLSACNEFDVMTRIREIAFPTWILVGEDDRLTPVKYAQYLHREIPGSFLTVAPQAGHLAMLEKPEEFNTSLTEFLSRSGLLDG